MLNHLKWLGLLIMLLNLTNGFGDVKAILFDCDGTLVDSEYAHYLGWKHALNALDHDLTMEEYYSYVGKSAQTVTQLLAIRTGTNCAETLLQMKRDYFRSLCKAGLPPIVNTVNFLKSLASEKQALKIKIGVCSAARKEEVLSHLKHLEIDHLLDVILSGQEDLRDYVDPEGVNKPKPYIYLHAAKILGVSPEETIVIEDSAPGVQAGVSAGCFTIAIPNDYTKHHNFERAHWRLDSFAEMNISDFLKQVKEANSG